MRILLLANSYPTVAAPGAAPYMTAHVRELRRRSGEGVAVTALALAPTYSAPARLARAVGGGAGEGDLALAPQGDLPPLWREAQVRWTLRDTLRAKGGGRPTGAVDAAARSVLAAVAHEEFDVVHAHGMYALPAGEVGVRVASEREIPCVVTMHGSDVTEAMAAAPEASARTLEQAAATVYVSQALRHAAWELGMPRQRAHVVPNGVDTEVFSPSGGMPHERTDGGPTLLFAGNLLTVKGADRLPGIVQAVASRHPGARLIVAGDGPLRERLRRELGDRARLLGRLPQHDVAALMRQADVLLVPSRSEGWGCVVSESYAVGTPVVASEVGGLVESVHSRAVLVPPPSAPDDPESEAAFATAFAARVCEVLAAPPAAALMREHVAAFSWSEVVGRELAVLRAAMGEAA